MNSATGELKLMAQGTTRLTTEHLRRTSREMPRTQAQTDSEAPESQCKDGVCALTWKPRRPAA